jgi:hypothetical protein
MFPFKPRNCSDAAFFTVCKCLNSRDLNGFFTELKAAEVKTGGLYFYGYHFNETVIGSRGPFWTSDKKMEP